LFVAGATLFLVTAGASVTSTGSGLAVPDWPLSFGQFFPAMEGGVLFEHGHRMIAGVVIVLFVALTVLIYRREERIWVKRLCLAGVVALGAQAALGGLTVLLKLPPEISVSHAGLAMAFFCLSVTVALVTSRGWNGASDRGSEEPDAAPLRRLALITTCAIYLQILLGAVMRHTGAGLVIPDFPLVFGRLFPTFFAPPIIINYAHRVGALLVTVLVVLLVVRIAVHYWRTGAFRRPALFLAGTLVVQVFLGALTIWTRKSVIPTTAHVAMGAVVLATSLVITLRAWRFTSSHPAGDAAKARGDVHHPSGILAADDLHLNSGGS